MCNTNAQRLVKSDYSIVFEHYNSSSILFYSPAMRSRNSSTMFWHSGAGINGFYEVLLLDEDRGWLLVGGRDHIYMLNSERLTQTIHKVTTVTTSVSLQHLSLHNLHIEMPQTSLDIRKMERVSSRQSVQNHVDTGPSYFLDVNSVNSLCSFGLSLKCGKMFKIGHDFYDAS